MILPMMHWKSEIWRWGWAPPPPPPPVIWSSKPSTVRVKYIWVLFYGSVWSIGATLQCRPSVHFPLSAQVLTLCLPCTNPLCAHYFGAHWKWGTIFGSTFFNSLYLFTRMEKPKSQISNACAHCEPEQWESLHWAIRMNNTRRVYDCANWRTWQLYGCADWRTWQTKS